MFISLHFAKKTHEKRSGESRITACQVLWGSKLKVARNSISWKLNCIDCIGVKKVWNMLSGLTNGDSCNFWFWPLPYSTMSSAVSDQFAYVIWRHEGQISGKISWLICVIVEQCISQCLIVDAMSQWKCWYSQQRKHSENCGNMRWLRIFTYSYQ